MINELKKSLTATALIILILFATLSIGSLINLFTPEKEALFFAWITSSIGFGCSTFAVIVLAYRELHSESITEVKLTEAEEQLIANALKNIAIAKSSDET